MIALVQRLYHNDKKTISQWFVDGEPECLGLEDTFHNEKVYGETRIPAGSYKVRVRKFGRLYQKYKERFPEWFEGMLELENVRGFTDILFHIGNDEGDTDGCLLTGTYIDAELDTVQSTLAFEKFYKKVIKAAKQGLLAVIIKDEVK